MECGVGEHGEDVQQEAGVGVRHLGPSRQLERGGTSSHQTWSWGTSSPPSASPHTSAPVVGVGVVVLVPRPVPHVAALLLLLLLMMMMVVVVVVVVVMMNVPLLGLYVEVVLVWWRVGRLEGVEGRLVQVGGRRKEARARLCQDPAGIVLSWMEVEVGHVTTCGLSVEVPGQRGRERRGSRPRELEHVGRVGPGEAGEVGVVGVDPRVVGLDGGAEEGRLEPVGRGDHAAVGRNVGRRSGEEELTSPDSWSLEQARHARHEAGRQTGGCWPGPRHDEGRGQTGLGCAGAAHQARQLVRHLHRADFTWE